MWITGTKFLSLSFFIFVYCMLNVYMDDVDDDTWEKICQIFHHTLGVVHFILDEKKIDNNFLGGWWPLMTIQKFCQTNEF